MESILEFLNFELFGNEDYQFTVRNLVLVSLVIILSRSIQWALKNRWLHLENIDFLSEDAKKDVLRFLKYFVQFFALLLIFPSAGIGSVATFLNHEFFKLTGEDGFTGNSVKNIILAILIARIVVWLTRQIIAEYHKKNSLDVGIQYSAIQFIKYIVYTGAILSIIDSFGYSLSVIWGGAAALLVGFGLGLQQTFNDLVSGIILLVERKVEVGDTVEVDGFVGTIAKIGIRTSDVFTRDNILVVVPNSHLVTSNVINWSHKEDVRRFFVAVGVAYGSNTRKIKDLLLRVAKNQKRVEQNPQPIVRFTNFGDSSLDFELHFWTKEIMDIDDLKSDIRFAIDDIFRENNIDIPFPQRVVWTRQG